MINCDKCGFGHKTFAEMDACKSWRQMQDEKISRLAEENQTISHLAQSCSALLKRAETAEDALRVERNTPNANLKHLASALKKFAPEAVEIILEKVRQEQEGYEEFVAFMRTGGA